VFLQKSMKQQINETQSESMQSKSMQSKSRQKQIKTQQLNEPRRNGMVQSYHDPSEGHPAWYGMLQQCIYYIICDSHAFYCRGCLHCLALLGGGDFSRGTLGILGPTGREPRPYLVFKQY